MTGGLTAALGYDPDRVAELPAPSRRALGLVTLAAAPPLGLLTGSAGYGAYLASDSLGLGVGVGLGAGLYLLNLLRVAVAGGGVGPQQAFGRVTTFMPRTAPLVMLALLGVFFAQPLLLASSAAEHDAQVATLRAALVELHARAVLGPLAEVRADGERALEGVERRLVLARASLEARRRELAAVRDPSAGGRRTLERAVAEDERRVDALAAEVARLGAVVAGHREREAHAAQTDVARYRQHLERSHFLLRRVQLTWARPLRATLLSLAMVLLMVLPWLAAATVGRTAARAYEANRWRANRALIDRAYAAFRAEEAAALARWPTFTGPRLSRFDDAPYDTRPRAGGTGLEGRDG
ncbi:MAG: hypothetical protein INH41_02910 [Myxococcaceae bacterium]|nr:hypothetical protein [Myxococcaceae bacterium]MCA3011330.1 hypothetical protein [Myxococcaceae bacterium]